jgi:hypothetical protein
LARTLVEVGEYAAADDLLEESLDVRCDLHGPESAVYATALLNCGIILLPTASSVRRPTSSPRVRGR